MASRRLAQFETDISRATDMVGLGQSYTTITHGVVDASDIYRAALVQAIAAVDHYFHGVVLDRAVDILLGRLSPGAPTKVGISFHAVQQIPASPNPADQEQTARTHVAQRLALETFQKSEAIGSALAMVGVPKVWSSAFAAPATPPTVELNLIVARRNRIVHQGDSDPLVAGFPTPLSDVDALDAVQTVKKIVLAIDPLC